MSPMSYDVHVADNPLNVEQSYWSAYLASLNPIAIHPGSYYRSQLYTEKTGINPLVTAAAPLLSLLGKLYTQQLLITEEFLTYIEHEFKAFLTQSSQQNYNKDILQMAYQMLRAAFVEAEQQTGEEVIEIHSPQQKTQIDFFTLYEQLRETMALDLLELGYLLISLGYRGKYGSLTDGKNQLEILYKHLYAYIRAQRGEFSRTLAVDELQLKSQAQVKPTLQLSFKFGLLALASVLTLLYGSFNYVLDLSTTPTYKELQHLQRILIADSEPLLAGAS